MAAGSKKAGSNSRNTKKKSGSKNTNTKKNATKKNTGNKKANGSKNRRKTKKKNNNKKIIIASIVALSIIALSVCLIIYLNRDKTSNSNVKLNFDASNINVLLTNGDNKTWDSISISCNKGMSWYENGIAHNAGPNESVTFSSNREQGTIIELIPGAADGRFTLQGKGSNYPGYIQLYYTAKGMEVTNYLPLEEYIKGVICSEMPESYGPEALKAQAVCARSYILTRNGKLAYEESNANVDDTVSFQVYGKQWAKGDALKAVEETAGQAVLTDSKEVANTMFYSTSCGYSQTQKADEFPYLSRKYISLSSEDPLKSKGIPADDKIIDTNKSIEDAFAEYIRNKDPNALEVNNPYFRWDCVLDFKANDKKVKDAISKNIPSVKADTLGEFKRMDVLKRSTGGVITSLSMEFANGCVIMDGELVIRKVLGEATNVATLNDGSKKNVTSLFSSSFTGVANENGYHIYGGGFGHGCGMSQDGAKELAANGKSYIEIIQFFYKSCDVAKIY